MIAPPEYPDWADVQRLVVHGYNLNRSRHFVLQVKNPAGARGFLADLVQMGLVTDASVDNASVKLRKDRGCCPANIGFTFRGLEKLELPLPYLRVFQEKAKAFADGACPRAAQRLADTGASASQWWDECFQPDHAHVLLSVYADGERELDLFTEALEQIPGAAGLDGWKAALDGCHLSAGGKERTAHFGFRDGISNPLIKGFHTHKPAPQSRAPKAHAAGEFVLGYENDDEFNPWLLVNPGPLPNPWLPPSAPIDPGFFRNGSFAAFRKIEQHEQEFRAFVSAWATRLSVTQEDISAKQEYIKAKLVGRWNDGQVVKPDTALTPKGRDPGFDETKINDFTFLDDPNGEGCPFGAHIRRMNPRADPVVPLRRRPLARRGMPYGPSFDVAHEAKRGLLGLFFCASLEDQFEHLLAEWGNANPMGPDNRGNAKDPLIGKHENPGAVFDIPVQGERLSQLDGFTPFVTTRGTLYAFYPGLAALRTIAQVDAPAHDEA